MAAATVPHLSGTEADRIRLYLETSQSDSDNTSVEYVRTTAKSKPQTPSTAVLAPLANPESPPNDQTPNKRKETQVSNAPAPKRVSKLAHDCKFVWFSPPPGKDPNDRLYVAADIHLDELGREWIVSPLQTKNMVGTVITAHVRNFDFLPPRPFKTTMGVVASFMVLGPNRGKDQLERSNNYNTLCVKGRYLYGLGFLAAKYHEDQLSKIYEGLVKSKNGWNNTGCRCGICSETS